MTLMDIAPDDIGCREDPRRFTKADLSTMPVVAGGRYELYDGCVFIRPGERPFTEDDLAALPDDNRRYELLDGALIVVPAPGLRHQVAVMAMYRLLYGAAPADLFVMIAPFDVRFSKVTIFEPDVLVARRTDFAEKNLPAPPSLAVEVLSPSTRKLDLERKKEQYEREGVPTYWVVDPRPPSLTVWEMRRRRYVEVARVVGDESFRAERPFPVSVTPARLLDDAPGEP